MNNGIKNSIDTIKHEELLSVLGVWEASVRATHNFLTEHDIQFFRSLLKKEIFNIAELACIRDIEDNIIGFIGVEKEKVEMLFILPSWRGRGIGHLLMTYALNVLNAKYVDVNEQNEQALGFYNHLGFKVIGRSKTDSMDKPFPLLHMQL